MSSAQAQGSFVRCRAPWRRDALPLATTARHLALHWLRLVWPSLPSISDVATSSSDTAMTRNDRSVGLSWTASTDFFERIPEIKFGKCLRQVQSILSHRIAWPRPAVVSDIVTSALTSADDQQQSDWRQQEWKWDFNVRHVSRQRTCLTMQKYDLDRLRVTANTFYS